MDDVFYKEIKETLENAKRDLDSGIKREQLQIMLNNNLITKENYDEILESIESLEMIVSLYTPMVESIERDMKNE